MAIYAGGHTQVNGLDEPVVEDLAQLDDVRMVQFLHDGNLLAYPVLLGMDGIADGRVVCLARNVAAQASVLALAPALICFAPNGFDSLQTVVSQTKGGARARGLGRTTVSTVVSSSLRR